MSYRRRYSYYRPKQSKAKSFEEKLGFSIDNITNAFLCLDCNKLEHLFVQYGKIHGGGAEKYARNTYEKWKNKSTHPSWGTLERLLKLVPQFMTIEQRKQIVKVLYEKYRPIYNCQLTISTDNQFEGYYEFSQIVNRYKSQNCSNCLPADVCELLEWVNHSDMIVVREILAESDRLLSAKIEKIAEVEIEKLRRLIEDKDAHKGELKVQFPNGSVVVRFERPSLFKKLGNMLKG